MLCSFCHDFLAEAYDRLVQNAEAELEAPQVLQSFRAGAALHCSVCLGFKNGPLSYFSKAAVKILSLKSDVEASNVPESQSQVLLKAIQAKCSPGLPKEEWRVIRMQIQIVVPLGRSTSLLRIASEAQAVPLLMSDDADKASWWQPELPTTIGIDEFWVYVLPEVSAVHREAMSLYTNLGLYPAIVFQISSWLSVDLAESHKSKLLRNLLDCKYFYPSRLVSLECLRDGIFKLMSTKDWAPDSLFASLSYRWEAAPACQLLKSNMRLLMSGLSVKELSANMSQAMHLVRDLGIDYIWIDALCIMQDDPGDWQRESLQMERIYSNAVINVAMNIDLKSDTPLLSCLSNTLSLAGWPYCLNSRRISVDRISPRDKIAHGSLAKRAWCFQERMLAKRTIHIMRDAIIWEGSPDEIGSLSDLMFPQGVPGMGWSNLGSRFSLHHARDNKFQRHIAGSSMPQVMPDLGFLYSWFAMLGDYTQRMLTFAQDRLRAIEAVAQRLESNIGYKYLLGVWLELLPFCLSWHQVGGGISDPDLPSWSWARCHGILSQDLYLDTTSQEQEAPSVYFGLLGKLTTENETTPALALYGRLLGPYEPEAFSAAFHDFESPPESTFQMTQEIRDLSDALKDLGGSIKFTESDIYFDDEELSAKGSPNSSVWLSPTTFQAKREDGTEISHLHALVLEEVSTPHRQPTYRRLGLVEASQTSGSYVLPQAPVFPTPDPFTQMQGVDQGQYSLHFMKHCVWYTLI